MAKKSNKGIWALVLVLVAVVGLYATGNMPGFSTAGGGQSPSGAVTGCVLPSAPSL